MDITVKLTYEYKKCANGGKYPSFEHFIILECDNYLDYSELEKHLRMHFKWLNENIGFHSYNWVYPPNMNGIKFYFRDKEDAMAFKLVLF